MAGDGDQRFSNKRRGILKGIAVGSGAVVASPLGAMGRLGNRSLERAVPDLRAKVSGRVFAQGGDGYAVARDRTAYRLNKPDRYPAVVVQPHSESDVIEAVNFAAAHGIKVTTRSGGHAWSASHIRDNCLLIDMSRMQQVSIDADAATLWTNPGVIGSRLNTLLEPHDLLVPTAHHPSPGIGGFCMNGGFGWNSRKTGTGAQHVEAVEVVTADGELIRADANQNSDYYWAVRGSGQGFFGVVTKIKLRCDPRHKVWKTSVYSFGEDELEDVFAWSREMVDKYPDFLEVILATTAYDRNTGDRAPLRLTLAGLAITDSEEEADAALDLMKSCPARDKATFKLENVPTDLTERYMLGYAADPAAHRFAADNVYTNAPADVLVPRLRSVFADLPSPRTHVFWMSWGPTKPLPDDMALSVQGEVYIAGYTLWNDPALDEEMRRWPVDRMMLLDDISVGGQMNDENMLDHPQDYLSPAAYEKLERLRARHDPDNVFESFLGKPYKPR